MNDEQFEAEWEAAQKTTVELSLTMNVQEAFWLVMALQQATKHPSFQTDIGKRVRGFLLMKTIQIQNSLPLGSQMFKAVEDGWKEQDYD